MINNTSSRYLIEIKLQGRTKSTIKYITKKVEDKYNLLDSNRVPHITLIQSFSTRHESRLINDFKKICKNSKPLSYSVKGIGIFPFYVIYAKVHPSKKLFAFRKKFIKTIRKYCYIYNYNRPFKPHISLIINVNIFKFLMIWFYLLIRGKIDMEDRVSKIILFKNSKIIAEYDFDTGDFIQR